VRMHCGNGNGDMSDLNRRFLACFVQAMDDAGLPDDAAFRAAMRGYMQWAIGDVSGHAEPHVDIPDDAPVPRWSWDGLQPSGSDAGQLRDSRAR
jgi:hemoglobin